MSGPQHRDRTYLQHILDAIGRIELYLTGIELDRFLATPLVQDAVVRQLEIIGEATKRLTEDTRAKAPETPWRKIAGMRDKLTHDYMGTDLNAVWTTTQTDLAQLRRVVEALLRDTRSPNGF
jgi:uncharacterized protein with HEPN domain